MNGKVQPRQKLSTGKRTWPGKKQVYRRMEDGRMSGDRITLSSDVTPRQGEEALLHPVMEGGRLLVRPTLESARHRCHAQLAALPKHLRRLEAMTEEAYPVERDPSLERAAARTAAAAGETIPDSA